MTKEMLISSSPHETKIALLEDDQLVEVYYERDTDVGLAGGIYKGRVSRVLPGMQSAFVDIGLERDAFLYVSDFFEESEEYDRVFTEAENRVARLEPGAGEAPPPAAEAVPAEVVPEQVTLSPGGDAVPDSSSLASPSAPVIGYEGTTPSRPSPAETISSTNPSNPTSSHHRGFEGRRRRGRRFSGHRFGGAKPEFHDRPRDYSADAPHQGIELLPGETLAKYGHAEPPVVPGITSAPEAESKFDAPTLDRETSIPEPEQGSDRAELDGGPEATTPREAADTADFESTLVNFTGSPAVTSPEPMLGHRQEEIDEETRDELRLERAIPEPEVPPASENQPVEDILAGPAWESVSNLGPDVLTAAAGELIPFPAESTSGDANNAAEDGESAAPGLAEIAGAENGNAPEAGGGEPDAGREAERSSLPESAGESAERSFTLREPHQRPRFAPRRRRGRGRFGFHGQRESAHKNDAPRAGNFQAVQINEVLKEGQEILVQIAKEPLGTKGARITSHIALPGRYLVYMPTITHTGVSRKISSEEERLRLRNIVLENRGNLTGGIIVRTAAAGRSEEELKADLKFLGTLWSEIRAKTERSKAPALIHRDLNVIQRTLRDLLSPDFKTIRIDNEIEYEQVVDFVSRCQPSLVGRVRLYTREVPLFEEFGVQQEIDRDLKPKIWLKSGGYIVINQTEALVSIDVNTGKYVGKTNRLEDTIVKVNIDAVKEIVRQIRVRDLGGIIVIDFIDMDDRRNRNRVVQALEEALRTDRAPTKILSFNEFGLVALTRKRVKQSLERTLCDPCPYCTGSGWVKSVLTVSYEILAEARKMASQIENNIMTLRVHPEVARALKSRDGVLLSEIESATRKEIVIKSDSNVQQERFEIF